MAVAAAVACMNMLIVMQDWDFPDMNREDVKIAATDFTEININWSYLKSCGPVFKWVFDHLTFYISGKWFNYMNIFIAVGFDWSYWYMTALVFRPCGEFLGCGLWVVGCGLWVVGCEFLGCGLWVVGCGLWVVGCGLWVVDYGA
jgi:hypothetical protein